MTEFGGGSLEIISTLALSTSIPRADTICPSTIPSRTMKWLFSQLKTKFISIHRFNTLVKFWRQWLKEDPKTEKSSMKTSRNCPTMSEKMDNIQRWKVAGALHRPKGIRLKANVPKGKGACESGFFLVSRKDRDLIVP